MRGLSLISALLFLGLGSPAEPPQVIAVVVHKTNPLSNLSLANLARIYRGQETQWQSGERIFVVNRPATSVIRGNFYRQVLRSGPYEKHYLAGTPVPFQTLVQESAEAVKLYVTRVPEAIGYIWLSEVDGSVRVVKIDNVFPTEDAIDTGTYALGPERYARP